MNTSKIQQLIESSLSPSKTAQTLLEGDDYTKSLQALKFTHFTTNAGLKFRRMNKSEEREFEYLNTIHAYDGFGKYTDSASFICRVEVDDPHLEINQLLDTEVEPYEYADIILANITTGEFAIGCYLQGSSEVQPVFLMKTLEKVTGVRQQIEYFPHIVHNWLDKFRDPITPKIVSWCLQNGFEE